LPPCKRSAVKNYTILAPAGRKLHGQRKLTSSQVTTGSDFTSKASLGFGEDVKKRLRLLSEVVLRTVKRRLTSSFAIFFAKMLLWDCLHFIQAIPHFCKKNGGERGIQTLDYSPCEITLKKMFYSAF